MRSILLSVLALALVACEGPEGPMGPEGPPGPAGPPSQGILIEKQLSSSAYDENGLITIEDSRITPETFRALYLKADFGGGRVAFVPLDYLLIYSVSLTVEELEFETPVLFVVEGALGISDPNGDLFAAAIESFRGGATINLAVLVSG